MQHTIIIQSYWANRQPIIRRLLKESGLDYSFNSKAEMRRNFVDRTISCSQFIVNSESELALNRLCERIHLANHDAGYDQGIDISTI